jgi:hypothetical protein
MDEVTPAVVADEDDVEFGTSMPVADPLQDVGEVAPGPSDVDDRGCPRWTDRRQLRQDGPQLLCVGWKSLE